MLTDAHMTGFHACTLPSLYTSANAQAAISTAHFFLVTWELCFPLRHKSNSPVDRELAWLAVCPLDPYHINPTILKRARESPKPHPRGSYSPPLPFPDKRHGLYNCNFISLNKGLELPQWDGGVAVCLGRGYIETCLEWNFAQFEVEGKHSYCQIWVHIARKQSPKS